MNTKTKIIIIISVFLVGGLVGRFTKSVPTQIEVREVEKIVYKESKDIKKVITREKYVDGSVKETITIEDKTVISKETDKKTESSTKYARTLFFGGVGTSVNKLQDVQYNAGVIRDQVIGDIGVGAFMTHKSNLNDTTINVVISYGF